MEGRSNSENSIYIRLRFQQEIHYFSIYIQRKHNYKNPSRRLQHQESVINSRLPGHDDSWPGHTTANPGHPVAAHQIQSQPPKFHRGPPANQPLDQRFIIARGLPEASSLHGNATLRCGQPLLTSRRQKTANKPRPNSSDCTKCDTNQYRYICVCGTAVGIPMHPHSTSIDVY